MVSTIHEVFNTSGSVCIYFMHRFKLIIPPFVYYGFALMILVDAVVVTGDCEIIHVVYGKQGKTRGTST